MRIINNQLSIIDRQGAALLVVLFIVMAITVLSLGFLSRSDVELACGENMILRTQMDYLAESGLEHAKGLILSPQDISGEYWTGDTAQQLIAGSDDYYDVSVVRHDSNSGPTYRCNYQIINSAYRLKGGEEVGRSSLTAELRLDPYIAYWQTDSQEVSSEVTINGDVYCGGNLLNYGTIRGDVFAAGSITNSGMSGASITGSRNEDVSTAPVSLPGLAPGDFSSYYYIGSTQYSVVTITAPDLNDVTLGPTPGNPAGIYYYNGTLNLREGIYITGMLVVENNLHLRDDADVTITAVKNFPALLVGDDIRVENNGAELNVTGFAQIGHRIDMKNKAGSSIDVLGALYVLGDGIKNTDGCSVDITAAPNKAALQIWPEAGTAERWSPAAGAFFKSITRN